jgi:hypothetical protein
VTQLSKQKECFLNTQQPQLCCPIVELRQYTLHQGQREVLIELFDREFVESQEALGMDVIGQFRDLDVAATGAPRFGISS